jgi:hypothetical protein
MKKKLTQEELEAKGLLVCDNFDTCGNLATRNIQESLITWTISSRGNYSKSPVDYEEIGDINAHLCDNCELEL